MGFLWSLFNADFDNLEVATHHFILDNGEYFPITEAYADMGKREGWLIHSHSRHRANEDVHFVYLMKS